MTEIISIIKLSSTVVQSYGEGDKETLNQREDEGRGKISTVRRAGALTRAGSSRTFWRKRGLPLPCLCRRLCVERSRQAVARWEGADAARTLEVSISDLNLMRAATGCQRSSIRRGERWSRFGWLKARCAVMPLWAIWSGFTAHVAHWKGVTVLDAAGHRGLYQQLGGTLG